MSNQSMTLDPTPVAATHGEDFYMIDVDLVREWDGSNISTTFYTEEWDVSDLLAQGYEVVGTYVW